MSNNFTHCPECGTRLNAEEQAIGECYTCGWPNAEMEAGQPEHSRITGHNDKKTAESKGCTTKIN